MAPALRVSAAPVLGLLAFGSLAVMAPSPADAFVIVTVGTTESWAGTYQVDTVLVNLNDQLSPPPAVLSSQPFWTGGNNISENDPDNAFATALATAVGNSLGLLNFGGNYGPFFAWGINTQDSGIRASAYNTNNGLVSRNFSLTSGIYTFATATPVPAPLPILGPPLRLGTAAS